MKKLTILGSTGSIGAQTLEIVENYPDKFKVSGLSARNNWELLARQARSFSAEVVAIANDEHYNALKNALADTGIKVLAGDAGICGLAAERVDIVVVALVGISGLLPTLKAIEAGNTIALANKETLVVGGELVMKKARGNQVPILPVDSEHSAIFQCLNRENPSDIKKILLTSSGGPFRITPAEELKKKTSSDALKHPNWDMGKKVTVDSSTLMNKGFEVIEAHWLFDVDSERIQVLVHPQSVIHSMVEFVDGSIIAQLSLPDMRIPIQYALSYPGRLPADFVKTDFFEIGRLDFEKPRMDDFPCLKLAYESLKLKGTMPAVLNGANEVAVELFLKDKIGFLKISEIIEKTMENHVLISQPSLEDLLDADAYARQSALLLAE
ncbi:MAG: 1-deoxy-D-xylulose-5-phosphate reductoisomerase [Vulcanimicrobiota bacterium]